MLNCNTFIAVWRILHICREQFSKDNWKRNIVNCSYWAVYNPHLVFQKYWPFDGVVRYFEIGNLFLAYFILLMCKWRTDQLTNLFVINLGAQFFLNQKIRAEDLNTMPRAVTRAKQRTWRLCSPLDRST
jgi:hypothetical protein